MVKRKKDNHAIFQCPLALSLLVLFVLLLSVELRAEDVIDTANNSYTQTDLSDDDKIDFVLRLGQGGFRDKRSPQDSLGGGQFALDIKPRTMPFALSLSSEYYTNSPDPTHSYEISSLHSINLLYASPLPGFEIVDYLYGGGIGSISVPRDDSNSTVSGVLYNVEAGLHIKKFESFGFYGLAKYLNANRTINNTKVIDFNEFIILLGITYRFSLNAPY